MPEIAAKQTEFERVVRGRIDERFIDHARSMAQKLRLSDNLSTSQIRRIFAAVKSLEMRMGDKLDHGEILILLPRLAYARKRDRSLGDLADELSAGIRAVTEKDIDSEVRTQRFRRLSQAFEAVLAYHKSEDQRDDRGQRPQGGYNPRNQGR